MNKKILGQLSSVNQMLSSLEAKNFADIDSVIIESLLKEKYELDRMISKLTVVGRPSRDGSIPITIKMPGDVPSKPAYVGTLKLNSPIPVHSVRANCPICKSTILIELSAEE